MSVVEERYAHALLSLTSDKESASSVETAFQGAVDAFTRNAQLKEFLCNPLIVPKSKHEMIEKVFTDVPEVLMKFFKLLIDKFRIDLLPGIFRQFVELRDEREGVLRMQIFSCVPLEEDKVSAISDKFSKQLGVSEFRIQTKIDTSLIGGVKVIVGDKIFDGSISSRLGLLKNAITNRLATANID